MDDLKLGVRWDYDGEITWTRWHGVRLQFEFVEQFKLQLNARKVPSAIMVWKRDSHRQRAYEGRTYNIVFQVST